MGWWETNDGTVIGDSLADIVGEWLDKLVGELVKKYPTISRDQVLHTLVFCSGYFKQFDGDRKLTKVDKILQVMTVKQSKEWVAKHRAEPDMSKRVAPNTELVNVLNPFTGDIV